MKIKAPQGVKCPACSRHGRSVKSLTLHALLKEEYRNEVADYEPNAEDACGCTPTNESTNYWFCDSVECDVVYFSETAEQVFSRLQLRVPVGVKETHGDRPLCYCFGHSVASIKNEFLTQGHSDALEDIRQKMKDPGCWCEVENPSGSCCLGSVAQGIKTAQEELGMAETANGNALLPSAASLANRGEAIAKVGTLVSAVMASACCWLPLVLLAAGVSGAGIASTLEAYRPLFMMVTFIFLGAAFYFTYWPKKTAAEGERDCCATEKIEGCCSSTTKGRQNLLAMNKIMLWGVTVMSVAFLLFPSYVGAFLGSDGSVVPVNMNRSVFDIEGMTCEGCSAIASKTIRSVPGVLAVEVSYEDGQAVIGTEEGRAFSKETVIRAIETAGYTGAIQPARDE